MQLAIHGDRTELDAFVCEHLSVCFRNSHPEKLPAVFIILIESMNKINCFLGHCFTFFLARLCKYPLPSLQFSCIFRTIHLWPRIRNQSQHLQFFCIWSVNFLLHSSMQLSFFFGDSYSKKSASDTNLSCELSVSIIYFMFSFSGGLVNFSHLVTHCHITIFDLVIHHWILFFQYFGHIKINCSMSITITAVRF